MMRVDDLPPTFTTDQARALGVHPRELYAWRDDEAVLELSRGVFRRADALHVPGFVIDAALKLHSPDGRSYGERLRAALAGRPADLWRYRELFLILTWRDVAVQYKQTVVGILWAVLRPLLTMAAFTFVFAKVAKLPSEGSPAGVPWDSPSIGTAAE